MYFGGSIAISVASAAAVFRTPALLNLVTRGGFISLALTLAALIGTSMVMQSIPYQPGFGAKQLAWITHSAMVGAVIAPMAFLGGPILLRAAWYTAGVVGGLSAVAVCAPSEKFLNMGGPLAIGLGVVFMSSIGNYLGPVNYFIKIRSLILNLFFRDNVFATDYGTWRRIILDCFVRRVSSIFWFLIV